MSFFKSKLVVFSLGFPCLSFAQAPHKEMATEQTSQKKTKESHAEGALFETVTLGDNSSALILKRHGNMHLSGSPTETQMSALKKAGIVAIADIRQPNEDRSELQKSAKEKGMVYKNIPLFLLNSKTIDAKAVDAITAFHKSHHDEAHLIACASGNRSSAWFAAHMGKDHNLSADKAVAAGKEAFLRDDMEAAVRTFLK